MFDFLEEMIQNFYMVEGLALNRIEDNTMTQDTKTRINWALTEIIWFYQDHKNNGAMWVAIGFITPLIFIALGAK